MVENQFRAMEYRIIQLTLPNKTSGSVHPQTLLSLCPIFFSQIFPFQIGACWWIGHIVPIRKEILALCNFGAMCGRHLIPVPLKTTEQTRSKRRVCSESGYFSMLIFPIILAGDFVWRLMNSHFGILGTFQMVIYRVKFEMGTLTKPTQRRSGEHRRLQVNKKNTAPLN